MNDDWREDTDCGETSGEFLKASRQRVVQRWTLGGSAPNGPRRYPNANHGPDLLGEYGDLQDMRMPSCGVRKGGRVGRAHYGRRNGRDLVPADVHDGPDWQDLRSDLRKTGEGCSSLESQTDHWAQSLLNADALRICKIERASPVGTLALTPRAVPWVSVAERRSQPRKHPRQPVGLVPQSIGCVDDEQA
jgi:hypothetical protein